MKGSAWDERMLKPVLLWAPYQALVLYFLVELGRVVTFLQGPGERFDFTGDNMVLLLPAALAWTTKRFAGDMMLSAHRRYQVRIALIWFAPVIALILVMIVLHALDGVGGLSIGGQDIIAEHGPFIRFSTHATLAVVCLWLSVRGAMRLLKGCAPSIDVNGRATASQSRPANQPM